MCKTVLVHCSLLWSRIIKEPRHFVGVGATTQCGYTSSALKLVSNKINKKRQIEAAFNLFNSAASFDTAPAPCSSVKEKLCGFVHCYAAPDQGFAPLKNLA
jgi:hypothetical protein